MRCAIISNASDSDFLNRKVKSWPKMLLVPAKAIFRQLLSQIFVQTAGCTPAKTPRRPVSAHIPSIPAHHAQDGFPEMSGFELSDLRVRQAQQGPCLLKPRHFIRLDRHRFEMGLYAASKRLVPLHLSKDARQQGRISAADCRAGQRRAPQPPALCGERVTKLDTNSSIH